MTNYFDRGSQFIAGAIGPADLTAWDNGQAALVVGELIAIDRIINASIEYCEPTDIMISSTTPPLRLDGPPKRGKATITTLFQTGIFDYLVMGACTTTEATPNTHAITFTTGEDPPYFALHGEKEETTNPVRDDAMGFIWFDDVIECSEDRDGWIAMRTTTGEFAFSGAGADLAEPTALSLSDYKPYAWNDYKNGSGASAFTYDGGAINFEITKIKLVKSWAGHFFTAFDDDGYPTVGKYLKPYHFQVDLEGYRTDGAGTDIATIVGTKPGSYAGDLDFIADFYQSASKYHKSTYDDMKIEQKTYKEIYTFHGGSWIPGHSFSLVPRNNTSSLAIEEKNGLNNDSYENPA